MLGRTGAARSLHVEEAALGLRRHGGAGDLFFLDAGNLRIGLSAALAKARTIGAESFEVMLAAQNVRVDPYRHQISLFGPP